MSPQTQAENKSQKNANSKDGVAEDEVEEEIIEMPQRSIYDKIYELAEKFAATRMGQIVTEKGDGVLKVIEDTAKWSVPQKKTDIKLERPLSWIPFLSLIITLRLLRVWLSLGALMIGNSPVSAADMVYFLQTRRRKLRAVRMHGAKAIRRREKEASLYRASNSNDKGLMGKLRKLMSRAICRPGQHSGDMGRPIFMRQPEASDATSRSERQAAKRPRDDSCNDLNLTIDQMLHKYANEDSEDDSDYVPNPEEDTNDDSSTINSSSSANSGDEENNENPPEEEENKSAEMNKGGADKTVVEKQMKIESESTLESDYLGTAKQQPNPKAASNGIDKPQPEAANKQNHTSKATNNPSQNNNNSKPPSAGATNGHDDKPKSLTSNETSSSSSNGNKPLTSSSTAMAVAANDFNEPLESTNTTSSVINELLNHLPNHQKTPFNRQSSFEITSNDAAYYDDKADDEEELNILNPDNINQFSEDSSPDDPFYSPIGSPTDFSTCFLPQTIPNPTNAMNTHSTPKSAEENAETQTQTATRNRNIQRHNFYPNNRNRGRNHQRRHF